ncbi:MAG: leucine-rich repeat protein, partial [Lachnospiraceae bacterium]|nr:leucine-rich repeat protein [Lachnospiraceae bacterium]
MKRIRLILIPLLAAALFLTGRSVLAARPDTGKASEAVLSAAKDDPESLNQLPSLKPLEQRPYTVMVYMIGSDLESKGGNATLDMYEMEDSGLDPEKSNLLLYTGGCRSWKADIPSNQNCVIDMRLPEEERIVAATEGSADMGLPETLSSFINFCTKYYPAEHYMLILWDHGGGPLKGYGNDELFGGDSLLLSEMKEAMNATIFGKGQKLDLVGFDACLMGCYENMSQWRSFARYYVGSEELEPGNGWDYHFLSVLNDTTDPREIAASITTTFSDFYKGKTTETFRPQITLSCTDLSKVPQVTSALRSLFSRMENGVKTGDLASISRIRSSALSFGRVQTTAGSYSYDLVDLTDLMTKFFALYPSEAAALRLALADFLVCNVTTIENAGGISLFYPCENKGQFEKNASLYKTINISPAYSRFLDSIASEWLSSKTRDWDLGSLSFVNGELQLQLTEEQLDNMYTVYYTVMTGDGGSYVPLMDKITLTPDRRGIVHVPADPKVFYLDPGGTDVTLWNVSQTGSSRSRLYYQTDNMLLYTDANPLGHLYGFDSQSVYVSFSTDLRGGNLKIGSISATAEASGSMGKDTVELQDWEAVSHVEARRVPTRDAGGRLLPASQWNTSSVTSFYVCPYKNDFTFGMAPASSLSENCVCQVVLEDVSGEAYATELYRIGSQEYHAAELEMIDGTWSFLVYGDHAALVDYTGSSTRVTVPPKVEGVPVTEIFSGAFGEYTMGDRYGSCPIESIILPSTLKILHSSAFYHCTKLRTIRLPQGLVSIGDMAFSGCQSLREISIPSSVTSIGNLAFDSCTSLERAALPPRLNLLGKSLFMDCPNLRSITGTPQSGYRLKGGALYSEDGSVLIACPCRKGETVTVADDTREIGCGAFSNAQLSKIRLPKSLKRIGNFAFFNCKELEMPRLPDGLTQIGMLAFGTTFLGIDVTTLPEEPVEIHLGSALQKIGTGAFDGFGARYFTVSEDNTAFAAVDGHLTTRAKDQLLALAADLSFTYVIPEGILSYDWDKLDLLQIYDFPDYNFPTFHYVFPDSVTEMTGTGSGLSSRPVTVHASPGSAARIWAMQNNRNYSSDLVWNWEIKAFPLEEGTLYAKLTGDHAVILYYEGTGDVLTIPDTLDDLPVTVLGGGVYPIMMPKYYAGYDYSELGFEPDRDPVLPGTVVLPDTLTTLAAHCLENLDGLENVELPESVTVIEDNALGRLAGKSWVLPHGLTYVGAGFVAGYDGPFVIGPSLEHVSPSAFERCPEMAGFIQEGENEFWSAKDGLLYSADGRTLVCCMNASVTDGHFSVPEGTEVIGEYAFKCAAALQTADFPSSLQRISSYAFSGLSSLTGIRFAETEAPLSIGDHAFIYCGNLKDVFLPSATHDLGDHAFASCRSLEEIRLPEGLLTIDEYAFSYCSSLRRVVFNDHLTYIGDYAFSYCQQLGRIELPASLVTLG